MGLFSKVIKTGAGAKAFQAAKREASKPENQRKAKELAAKLRSRKRGGGTTH
ncbi:MAG: hypothetical protein H0U77_15115 [Nocardioidaceae bacterium]|nr:hypothetical protein [Nocardioidaceae bacterium]